MGEGREEVVGGGEEDGARVSVPCLFCEGLAWRVSWEDPAGMPGIWECWACGTKVTSGRGGVSHVLAAGEQRWVEVPCGTLLVGAREEA